MALRDQPYLPLYVDDFTNDEKLRECSAEATGVYIRIMLLMHKQNPYGKIMLEQKYQQKFQQNSQQNSQQTLQQNLSICSNFAGAFALKLLRHLPFTLLEIQNGICELLENNVLYVDGNCLCQKRMVKDGNISEKRASAGRKSAQSGGGLKNFVENGVGSFVPTKFPTNSSTKQQQNTVIEIENEIKGNRGIGNAEGVQGSENLGKEGGVEDINVDYYIGNWTLETEIENCLNYYLTHEEFFRDRNFGFELFKKQYIELPDDEIWDRLAGWGEIFIARKRGQYPKLPMRGEQSFVQWFHNWLRKNNLADNPKKVLMSEKKEEKNENNRHKTAEQILKERGLR